MNAPEAIAYIESCTWSATRLGLERTQTLLHALGDPQKRLRFVHIAGSNGKGSTSAMLASVLTEAGFRTGLYTSPYIQTFFERIQINGVNISGSALAEITERVQVIADQMDDHPSQFELVTAIAMEYYAQQNCDIVVLEVGMGGALDSTNAIDAPEVAVITNIGLEHTEYLGNTLEAIAETKGGIIKPGCCCVAYPSAPEVINTLEAICKKQGVPIQIADTGAIRPEHASLSGQIFSFHQWKHLELPLLGAHQLKNASVALTVVDALRDRGWCIDDTAVYAGIARTKWPARMEVLHPAPLFLLDGGHNPQCAEALAEAIRAYLPGRQVAFLLGVLADKDSDTMLDIVAPFGAIYICLTPNNPRALSAEALAEKLRARGRSAISAADVSEGVLAALHTGLPVIAFGSLYLAGEIRTKFPEAIKRHQRKTALSGRASLSKAERQWRSEQLCACLLASDIYRNAQTILVYNAVGSEANLSYLIRQAVSDGKRICWPVCLSRSKMAACTPLRDDAWRSGAFGIREPDPEASVKIPPQEIDLVLCPCSGFDRFGHRLGMGAGYYDRYLPACTRALRVVTALEAQRAERIFTEATDLTAHYILTEAGLIPAEKE